MLHKPVENLVPLQQVDVQHSDGIGEWKVGKNPHDPIRIKLKEVLVGAGNKLTDAPAAPVSKVSEGHTGSAVGEEGLVNVALVGVIVADESRDAVETLGLILAEVENEGDQGGEDGAKVHVWEVFAQAEKDFLNWVESCLVETVSGFEKNERKNGLTDSVVLWKSDDQVSICTEHMYLGISSASMYSGTGWLLIFCSPKSFLDSS